MLKPLATLFLDFETALEFSNNLEKKSLIQSSTARLNQVSRRQRKLIENSVRQLLSIETLELKIDMASLLMNPLDVRKNMSLWNSAKTDLNLGLAEEFYNSCDEWVRTVLHKLSKIWDAECKSLIDRANSAKQFLISLDEFEEFKSDDDSNLSRLNSYVGLGPGAIDFNIVSMIKNHILKMEKKLDDLNPPTGIREFFKQIQSLDGYPLIEFNRPENSEIRDWMDDRNIMPRLILRLLS